MEGPHQQTDASHTEDLPELALLTAVATLSWETFRIAWGQMRT